MSVDLLKERLREHLKIDLELLVNENRSTMLNLLERSRYFVRLSVHKMFLSAPEEVISAIAHYVRGTRKQGSVLRQYIQQHLDIADYTYLVDSKKTEVEGRIYHLQQMYDAINQKYFNGELDLSITWYGRNTRSRSRTRITFGQYLAGLRLIKIHRMLDDSFFPDYFVELVIYHEMLHSVVPGHLDRGGRYCFHCAEFKARERKFEDYERAVRWERANKVRLFKGGG